MIKFIINQEDGKVSLEADKVYTLVIIELIDYHEKNLASIKLTEIQARDLAHWIINNTGI